MKQIVAIILLFSVIALARTADQVQIMPHTGNTPSWGQVDLSKTAAVKNQLPVANGGTNLASLTAHGILIGNGTSSPTFVSPGTLGNILQSNGTDWTSATNNGTPVGTIISFAGQTCAAGYLVTDGSAVSRSTYSTLFTVLGTAWGVGDGSTTFNVPDLRGQFERMIDTTGLKDPDAYARTAFASGTHNITGTTSTASGTVSGVSNSDMLNIAPGMVITGTGIPVTGTDMIVSTVGANSFVFTDKNGSAQLGTSNGTSTLTLTNYTVGANIGSWQVDDFKQHTHTFSFPIYQTIASSSQASQGNGSQTGNVSGTTSGASTVHNGFETRPENVYVLKCIKF